MTTEVDSTAAGCPDGSGHEQAPTTVASILSDPEFSPLRSVMERFAFPSDRLLVLRGAPQGWPPGPCAGETAPPCIALMVDFPALEADDRAEQVLMSLGRSGVRRVVVSAPNHLHPALTSGARPWRLLMVRAGFQVEAEIRLAEPALVSGSELGRVCIATRDAAGATAVLRDLLAERLVIVGGVAAVGAPVAGSTPGSLPDELQLLIGAAHGLVERGAGSDRLHSNRLLDRLVAAARRHEMEDTGRHPSRASRAEDELEMLSQHLRRREREFLAELDAAEARLSVVVNTPGHRLLTIARRIVFTVAPPATLPGRVFLSAARALNRLLERVMPGPRLVTASEVVQEGRTSRPDDLIRQRRELIGLYRGRLAALPDGQEVVLIPGSIDVRARAVATELSTAGYAVFLHDRPFEGEEPSIVESGPNTYTVVGPLGAAGVLPRPIVYCRSKEALATTLVMKDTRAVIDPRADAALALTSADLGSVALCVAGTRQIAEHLRTFRPDTLFCPDGATPSLGSSADDVIPRGVAHLIASGRPVIGCCTPLNAAFDIELFANVAANLATHHFVVAAAPLAIHSGLLDALPNVTVLRASGAGLAAVAGCLSAGFAPARELDDDARCFATSLVAGGIPVVTLGGPPSDDPGWYGASTADDCATLLADVQSLRLPSRGPGASWALRLAPLLVALGRRG